MLQLPEDVNPYAKDSIQILYKPEYLNRGGSGKGRPVSFMLYYYKELGKLDRIEYITTAGFGNFIRSLAELCPFVNPNITLVTYMSDILVDENKDLIDYLETKGVLIVGCRDDRCPTTNMERGQAIARAHAHEKAYPLTTLFLDQHAVFKPFDGILNAAGYYYTLAPEILHQIKETTNLYYVNGQGTRGSLVGTATRLKKEKPEIKIVGLRQQEDGHIFGLRSLKELGKSETLGKAEELCDDVYEISDREAYLTMKKLWEVDIPATPSGGSYVAGALRKAKELKRKNKEGTIVTLIFDSLDYYKNILKKWIPKILDSNLDLKTFESLRIKAQKEREEHIKKLKMGENELFNLMINLYSK